MATMLSWSQINVYNLHISFPNHECNFNENNIFLYNYEKHYILLIKQHHVVFVF